MACCAASCSSRDQALKSSGGTIFPSRIGAMVNPAGVRKMAMFWACAFSFNAAKAAWPLAWIACSTAPRCF